MFFDWAAQPFFTVIITFIFGPYFVASLGPDKVAGQTAWANAATVAGLVIALTAPLAGALSDAVGGNKRFICALSIVQIASLAMLWHAAPGSGYFWPAVMIVFATIAAELSVVFNDAMLPRLVERGAISRISNDAWGLGYLGGMIFLVLFLLFVSADPDTGLTILGRPPVFGLSAAEGEPARLAGPLAALWYLVFLMPMILLTPDSIKAGGAGRRLGGGLADFLSTLLSLRRRPALFRFFIARMLYMDGLNGLLILGGAFAASMFGWSITEIGIYGMILNVAAIFGCFVAARLSRRVSAGRVVIVTLSMLIAATFGVVSTSVDATLFGAIPLLPAHGGLFSSGAEKAFLLYGVIIGLAFGPVQAGSRAFLAVAVDASEAGRFFGLFSLTGRMTSFMATAGFALLTSWTGSPNIGMASLLVFLVAGLALFVPATVAVSDGRS
ncbi:MFS transporter [Martelella soudanensis]|uniref:MFS transporter n=1 Tax=unclassified Martelella TaxID=2629616 RepID=UPI001FEF8C49|nr:MULTISPECIES: MFS transporter [unclassified Martelella]